MGKYQTIIRFIPDVQETQVDELLEKAQSILEITRIDKFGYKKLAYSVRHKNKTWYNSAYTVCCNIAGDDKQISKFQKLMDVEEVIKLTILRSEK